MTVPTAHADRDPSYSLVVPVYKNAETIPSLLTTLTSIHEHLERAMEVIFVVDGSPDDSYLILRSALPEAAFPSQLIGLSRNFGSFAAIRMGLSVAGGSYFAIMAADLQEPPELIVAFFHSLRDEPIDIAIGSRIGRDDPFFSRIGAELFWAIYRRLIQEEIPPGGVDVFGCNRPVRDALMRLNESNSTLVGLLFWLGFRRKLIPYHRRPRPFGKSAWTLRRKARYLLDSAFAFTDLPIRLLLAVGFAGIVAATVGSIVVFLSWLLGGIPVAGYTPLMLALMMSLALTLLALGVVGSYVWRAFENTKQRPMFVPMSHERFPMEPRP